MYFASSRTKWVRSGTTFFALILLCSALACSQTQSSYNRVLAPNLEAVLARNEPTRRCSVTNGATRGAPVSADEASGTSVRQASAQEIAPIHEAAQALTLEEAIETAYRRQPR